MTRSQTEEEEEEKWWFRKSGKKILSSHQKLEKAFGRDVRAGKAGQENVRGKAD